jgi:hypothetical protein
MVREHPTPSAPVSVTHFTARMCACSQSAAGPRGRGATYHSQSRTRDADDGAMAAHT